MTRTFRPAATGCMAIITSHASCLKSEATSVLAQRSNCRSGAMRISDRAPANVPSGAVSGCQGPEALFFYPDSRDPSNRVSQCALSTLLTGFRWNLSTRRTAENVLWSLIKASTSGRAAHLSGNAGCLTSAGYGPYCWHQSGAFSLDGQEALR